MSSASAVLSSSLAEPNEGNKDDLDSDEESTLLLRNKVDQQVKQATSEFREVGFLDSSCVTLSFDAVAIVVSVADLVTDLLVLFQWHKQGRFTPFWISLTILITAQMSYLFVFISRYMNDPGWTNSHRFLIAVILAPIAPLISLIVYFSSIKDSCVRNAMTNLGFSNNGPLLNDEMTRFQRFIRMKLHSHMGFLMEALIEAFPQSILQMSVIVYFEDSNDWITVSSILISLISVCSKSLIFAESIDIRSGLFNYLSVIADFLSIFAIISWVFFTPHSNQITQLGWLFIYKVLYFSFPLSLLPLLVLLTVMLSYLIRGNFGVLPEYCLALPIVLFLTVFLIPIIEICSYSFIAYLCSLLYIRFTWHTQETMYFCRLSLAFIAEAQDWEECLMRVILVNQMIFLIEDHTQDHTSTSIDRELKRYLRMQEENEYQNVNWERLRQVSMFRASNTPVKCVARFHHSFWNSNEVNPQFITWVQWRNLNIRGQLSYLVWMLWCELIIIALFVFEYLLIPLHCLSRLFNIVFVWLAMAVDDWSFEDRLQLGMAVLVFVVQILWLFCLYRMLSLHFAGWHILCGNTWIHMDFESKSEVRRKFQFLLDFYETKNQRNEMIQMHLEHVFDERAVINLIVEYLPDSIYDFDREPYGLQPYSG